MSPLRRKKLTAAPHQLLAVKNVLAKLKKHRRAQLIMACGTGKTLVSLHVAEQGRFRTIVVFVPSLALVRQVLAEYTASTNWTKWGAIAVCSDASVTDDSTYLAPEDVGCQVTTERDDIHKFLGKAGVRVVFCTYHSAHLLEDMRFDLGIFDEAHKTAGVQGKTFAFALSDENVRIDRRLFMTATPRHVRVVNDQGDEEPIFSMTDTTVYGPVAYRLSFREAIKAQLICDYEIAIGVLLEDVNTAGYKPAQVAVRKAMVNFGAQRAITFHSNISRAKDFAADSHGAMHDIAKWHINGEMSTAERDSKLQELVSRGGVVTNVRCLSEGVDFPSVDMVAFIDAKRSAIDIVQVVGRCLRLDPASAKKKGIIFVPIYVHIDGDEKEAIAASKFDHVYDVLQALKEQDELLAEELRRLSSGEKSRIKVVAPEGAEGDAGEVLTGESLEKLTRAISVRLTWALRKPPTFVDWTKITKSMWRSLSNVQLAETLGCSKGYVAIHRPEDIPSPLWKRVDYSRVPREMWKTKTNREIAKFLDCDISMILLHRPKDIPAPKPLVTDAVTDEMWLTMTNQQIAKVVGCSLMSVHRARPTNIAAPKTDQRKKLHISDEMWRSLNNEQIAARLKCSAPTIVARRPAHIPTPPPVSVQRKQRKVEKLIDRATKGGTKPRQDTSMATLLTRLTSPSQLGYDKDIDRKLRQLAPHWFKR